MILPNSTRITYYVQGNSNKVIFTVDCPLGTPIPRIGEKVMVVTVEPIMEVMEILYAYSSSIPGIATHVKVGVKYL